MTGLLDHLNAALSDRYVLERELGHGGMALVYLARDGKLHRDVALKVLRPELTTSLGAARFVREIETAAKLPERALDGATDILLQLYRCYTEGDCDLAEINPLILKPTGEVHALDAMVTLDTSAAFRHPE